MNIHGKYLIKLVLGKFLYIKKLYNFFLWNSSTVPPETPPYWIICEPSISFCECLWEYFYDIKQVSFYNIHFFKTIILG